MIDRINEKLAIENQLLSDENLRLRKAYSELLNEYIQSMATKCPANVLLAGQREWENKIK